jgi:AraC family transcriptional regulator of adaptative response / DNA-3-methyladenine glycosylase II
VTEIAYAAGFASIRQFNDTVREVYATTPSQLRAAARSRPAQLGAGTLAVRLAYRPPLHAEALWDFLATRAIAVVEEVVDGVYRRALRLPHGPATAELTPRDGYVAATLRLADLRDLAPAVARCRRLLDLDADPVTVDATLAEDPALAPSVDKEPGVRVPRAVDGFEIAVRAVVGQQISVAGARTVLARLVRHTSSPTDPGLTPFPEPAALAETPDEAFGMPATRRETLRALSRTVAAGELDLDGGMDRAEVAVRLTAIPGIGAWTASYVALRALGDPDAFLPTDLGVRRGAAALGLPDDPTTLTDHAQRWRPWRGYAVLRLWSAG